MDYSGPATYAQVEADLALSDEEDITDEHWPPLELHSQLPGSTPWQPQVNTPHHATQASTSTTSKRPMSQDSDEGESSSPATKTTKRTETRPPPDPAPFPYSPHLSKTPHNAVHNPTAFAPRAEYVKLVFRDNPTVEIKIRWLTEVTRTYHLEREMAEVKMSAATSRFVYISRRRSDIIDAVKNGEVLSLTLDIQDSTERPRKFPTYLITRYPVGVDPSLAKELPGIYSVRRFRQDGEPINRLVVAWSLPDPPPSEVSFSFLPCLPSCEVKRMKDEQPWCYKCWGIGHISRYCGASSDTCGWCAGSHSSRTCTHRTLPQTSSTDAQSPTEQPSLPAPDKSMWKCPRCQESGVNVWHGCTRRSRTATPHTPTVPTPAAPPPPPPALRPRRDTNLPTLPSTPTLPPQVLALREAVANLTSRCTVISERFDAIEARIDSLATQNVTTERTLASLVESHQTIIATVTTFSEKLEALTSRFEKVCDLVLKEPLQRTTPCGAASVLTSPSVSRKPRNKK